MLKTDSLIPKKIKVGYFDHTGNSWGLVAVGKVGIITWEDKKGIKREMTWNSARDLDMTSDDFNNVPMKGFKLSKGVTDFHKGQSMRKKGTGFLISDPRGFEVEIPAENILDIIKNAPYMSNKEFDGEFVYADQGGDMILVPTNSNEYKSMLVATRSYYDQTILAKNLKVGHKYLTKDNCEYIYMGKFDYHQKNRVKRAGQITMESENKGKKFYFCSDGKSKFANYSSITKMLVDELSDGVVDNFDEIKEAFTTESGLYGVGHVETVSYSFVEFEARVAKKLEFQYSIMEFFNEHSERMRVRKCNKLPSLYEYAPVSNFYSMSYNGKIETGSLHKIFHFEKPVYTKVFLTNGEFYTNIES